MGCLLTVLSLLLAAATAAGGRHATVAAGAGETTAPSYYNSPSEVMAYWQTVLPNSPMPSAMLDHLRALSGSLTKEDGEKSPYIYGEYVGKSPYIYWNTDPQRKNDEKSPYFYGSTDSQKGNGDKSHYYWSTDSQQNMYGRKSPYIYWSIDAEKNGEKSLGMKEAGDESPYIYWHSNTKKDENNNKSPYIYWSVEPQKKDNGDKSPYIYWSTDPQKKKGAKKSPYIYWSKDTEMEEAGDKSRYIYWRSNSKRNENNDNSPYFYWSVDTEKKDDDDKSPYIYLKMASQKKEDGAKSPYIYSKIGSKRKNNGDNHPYMYWSLDSHIKAADKKSPYIYWNTHMKGPVLKRDNEKSPYIYGSTDIKDSQKKEDGKKSPYIYWSTHSEGHHYLHGAGHKSSNFDMANFLFTEDVLTPGTMLTPCIKPATSPAPFLRHDIADSISMSTKHFPNIMAMLAPAFDALASDIWSKLKSCEHVRLAEGENQTCATSMESVFKFATSVLGTRNLQAFSSSSDVPLEGISSGSQRFTVVAAKRVTAARDKTEETTMTCHGVEFPFAVFYCHAVNPTRVYEVTLVSKEDAPEKTMMRALVVCHLDTSRFDHENPFFAERHLKPGDIPLCHFLERGSILWAPAASTQDGHGHAAVR